MTDEVLKDIILNVLKCTLYVVHETPPPDYLNMMQASILGQNFTFRPMRSSLSVMEKCFFLCVRDCYDCHYPRSQSLTAQPAITYCTGCNRLLRGTPQNQATNPVLL